MRHPPLSGWFWAGRCVGFRVNISVRTIDPKVGVKLVVENHYLHRRVNGLHWFGLVVESQVFGVMSISVPASRHLQKGVCPSDPSTVVELSRLWVCDSMPHNSESWFVSRALKMLPPYIVVSFADTSVGHQGYIYRALNFKYAGYTDMDRKTPRFDYVVPGKHSRDAFRNGKRSFTERVRRKPKQRYWTVTGNRRDRSRLNGLCNWPSLDWNEVKIPKDRM